MHNISKTPTRKPIICLFIGYTTDFNVSAHCVGGSEISLINLAEVFSKTHNVYIFGACLKEATVNNVQYFNSNILNQFMNDNIIDVMIVFRYIYYFLEFNIKAKKIYVWLQDQLMQSAWDFKILPKNAKYLLENMIDKIDGIVVLTEWHRNGILDFYNFDPDKVVIIGNAIDVTRYNKSIQRVKNRFIYTSDPSRGLEQLVTHFYKIRQKLPDAELWIYRDESSFTNSYQSLLTLIKMIPYIKFMGRVENNDLVEHQMMADYWYYPTAFLETYCVSALEALMAGCICITSDIGALKDVISNRGVLVPEPVHTEEYFNKALEHIMTFANNEELKERTRANGILWAQNETWETRGKEWFKLFDYKEL